MDFETSSFLLGEYISLIFALLGFVLPLITALIALLPEATGLLAKDYKDEIQRSESNLANATTKRKEAGQLDTDGINTAMKELMRRKHQAEIKQKYLSPTYSILRIATLLVIAIGAALLTLQPNIRASLAGTTSVCVVSIGTLVVALMSLWRMFTVLVEATQVNNKSDREFESKVIDLLTAIAAQDDSSDLYVDPTDIKVKLEGKSITPETVITFSEQKQHAVAIALTNSGPKMIKNSELGFIFPKDFLVESAGATSLINDGQDKQILRYNTDMVYADENRRYGQLKFTPLAKGEFKIRCFLKAENLKPLKFDFKLEVVE